LVFTLDELPEGFWLTHSADVGDALSGPNIRPHG
jgi:hypothetical protein